MSEMTARDKWIPWYFVMAFAVVFAVNGLFVYLATTTRTGLVTDDAYEKGLAYDSTIAAAEAQATLGWQGEITFAEPSLRFTLNQADDKAITKADVTAHITRPTQGELDFSAALLPAADGSYQADITFPARGQWNITIVSTWNNHTHQTQQYVMLP